MSYDVSGGGIITEMVPDREETLRVEARQRDFAWVQGDVTLADRAKHYGHRAALVLLIGPDTTGKTFLAKKVESMLVAEGRHVYMLDPENLRRGLDADLQEGDGREMIRRYGEVARLFIDTGSPADFNHELLQPAGGSSRRSDPHVGSSRPGAHGLHESGDDTLPHRSRSLLYRSRRLYKHDP